VTEKRKEFSKAAAEAPQKDRLDSLNAEIRSKRHPAEAIRRSMEATMQRAATKRRRQEQPSSSMLKLPAVGSK